jgi:stage II sporulation protein E
VDLVTIDLFTGETDLYKYGAAPSYLKQGAKLRRIRGESLAAGLGLPPNDAPDHVHLKLQPGALAVIVSDGVTCGVDDGWLTALLEKSIEEAPRELSRSILRAAAEKFGDEDDMSVYVVSVTKRE